MEPLKSRIQLGTKATEAQTHAPVLLHEEERLRHMYVIGQTGTGKTTLLKNMAVQDIQAGEGLVFIDPHGREARDLLDYIPPERTRDVVYLNPADHTRAFGFNVLAPAPETERDRITQDLVATFRHLWADNWGARMDFILKNTIRALLDTPPSMHTTLLSVHLMFENSIYRERVLQHVKNPAALKFWRFTFPGWSKTERSTYTLPVINKTGQFLLSDTLRSIIGQAKSTIDLSYIMDNRRILIVDLDKSKIGADVTNMLGSLLMTALKLEVMHRADRPEEGGHIPCHCYLDEFHSFTTSSFAEALAEVRKYGFGMVLANQFLSQTIPEVRAAVFGNCGTFCAFRVGGQDAETIEQHIHFRASELVDLTRGEAGLRYTINQVPSTVRLRTPLLPPKRRHTRRPRIIRYSNSRYTTPIEVVDGRINKWLNNVQERY